MIAPVPDVSGRVVIENRPGGAAADIGRVQVGLKSTVATTLDVKPQLVSGADAFTLRNGTAGDYVVIVSPGFEKGYVKSIQLGSFDVLDDGLHTGNMLDGEMVIVS